jgi:hypothetical protein
MQKRSFDSFNTDELEELFKIKRAFNLPEMQQWIDAEHTITDDYKIRIKRHQALLVKMADAWNEDELKFFFIGPFIAEAELHTELYKPFTQRNMTIKLPELELNGKVEFMLAKGRVMPRKPFFFLHEYKQERRRETDPLAQVLLAMLAARIENQHDFDDYGCYVVGRNWFFVLFKGDVYEVSESFDATKEDDLFRIFMMIREVKRIANHVFAT